MLTSNGHLKEAPAIDVSLHLWVPLENVIINSPVDLYGCVYTLQWICGCLQFFLRSPFSYYVKRSVFYCTNVDMFFGTDLGQVGGGKVASKCNATRHDEADICMQKMFLIGDRTQRFRESLEQMHNYCK